MHGGSDGLVIHDNDSYGFMVCNRYFQTIIKGMGQVPYTATLATSQQAEYYGGYALAVILKLLQHWVGGNNLSMDVWIDNNNVLDTNCYHEQKFGIKSHLVLNYNLWKMTVNLIQDAHIHIDWNWVKRHQDDEVDY